MRWRSTRSHRGGTAQTMNARRSVPKALIGLLGVVAIVASACGSSTASTAPSVAASETPSAAAVTEAPSPSIVNITPAPIAAGPGPNGGTVVRWFIGLGAGTQPAQIGPEQTFI